MRELTDILTDLQDELTRALGSQLAGLYLYGSRARGEARPTADIDMLARTSTPVAALSLANDVVSARVFVSPEQFEHGGSPCLLNVRRQAVAL